MIPRWFTAFRLDREHHRTRQRITRYFHCTWQSEWGPQRSRISSLSPTGCYIEDRLSVPRRDTEIPELTIELPGGAVALQGIVLDAMPGVGFAVRFSQVADDTRNQLVAVTRTVSQA